MSDDGFPRPHRHPGPVAGCPECAREAIRTDKVCSECGGRASACKVLGHRPESDRHIQWQDVSPSGDSDAVRIADANLKALLAYTGGFYSVAMEHGMKRAETANAIAHVESAARALHRQAVASASREPTNELLQAARGMLWLATTSSGVRTSACHALIKRIDAVLVQPEAAEHVRPCTCHPDDNPPRPCPQKFALDECRKAAGPK